MQSLADVLKSLEPKPTHALFLAFDASPPFFDHEVLPAILNERLTDVTILVDALALNASSIDAGSTRKAGIFYRINGVRPNGGGKFHPKLVLLMHEDGVHALIGSANLTWTGWCRNIEVMDVLSFGPKGTAPAEAAVALAAFLETLPHVLRGLGEDANVLVSSQEALLAAAERTPPNDAGGLNACDVLSNVSAPLISQIEDRVTPLSITRVTVVSPFYDPTNIALARLAATYKGAPLSVIKDGLRADDFDGRSFLRLGKQHQLRETSFEEEPRPLHAKCVLLEGPDDDWLVSGSANLTTPAWLHAAKDGGNVELVTLRRARRVRASSKKSVSHLSEVLQEIPTTKVPDPSALQYVKAMEEDSRDRTSLHIIEAMERDWRLRIRWEVPTSSAAAAKVALALRSQDRSARGEFSATNIGTMWQLDVAVDDGVWTALFEDEIAVVAHLSQRIGSEWVEGVAWLRRPALLGQKPGILELRQRLRALSNGSSRSPEDLLNGIAALLETAQKHHDAFDLRLDVGTGRRDEASSQTEVLREMLRKLVGPRPAAESQLHGRILSQTSDSRSYEEDDDDEADEDRDKLHRDDQAKRAQALASHFRKLVSVARDYVDTTLHGESGTDERRLFGTAGLLLSGLSAAALTLRQSWLSEAAQEGDEVLQASVESIGQSRRDLWILSFSIDGWESGRCHGWFPLMATSEKWSFIAEATLWQPACIARLVVDLAEQAVVAGKHDIAAEAAFILQMLGRVSLPPTGDVLHRVESILRDEGRAPTERHVDTLLATLVPAGIGDLSGWERLRTWLPLVDVVNGTRSGGAALDTLPEELRNGLSPILRRTDASRYLAQVRYEQRRAICLACDTKLPSMLSAELASGRLVLKSCEGCNRILIPIDAGSAISGAILAADPARTTRRTVTM